MSTLRQALGLLAWVAFAFAPALVGSAATDPGWYQTLERPGWAPPSWLFGPVWTFLYLMMGIAAWLVWRADGFRSASGALTLFLVQLVLNGAWSWIFFGLREPGWALGEIVVLWALILATIVAFGRHRTAAAWLMAPYLAWVTFAAVLNFSIWRLNV